MGFWDRLIGPEPQSAAEDRRFLQELLASHCEEARLARQIRAHMDKAPHQAGIQALRTVAEEQDRLVQLLLDKITAVGGTESEEIGLIKEGKNHWARVVQDVEDNHALEQYYNEQIQVWDPDCPEAVALFRALQQGKSRLNKMLRDIALRADPHALN